MNMVEFVQYIRDDAPSTMVDGDNLVQKLYIAERLWSKIPDILKETWQIDPTWFIGIEHINPGCKVELHTDLGRRRTNILINVGDHPVTIQHSNNDVLEDHTIPHHDFFILNASKLHGCDNTHSIHKAEFLTINPKMRYEKCIALY